MTRSQKIVALVLIVAFYGTMAVRYLRRPRRFVPANSQHNDVGKNPGHFQLAGRNIDRWLGTGKPKSQ
jgi:hypothetical protein